MLSTICLRRNISRFSTVLYQKIKPKEATEAVEDVEQNSIKFKKLQLNDKLLSNLMLTV